MALFIAIVAPNGQFHAAVAHVAVVEGTTITPDESAAMKAAEGWR